MSDSENRPETDTEKRRQHRIGVSLEIHIAGRDRHGIAFEEVTHSNDVSRGGCSFRTTHEVASGAELQIEIIRHITGSQSSFLTRGVVLRVSPENPDGWLLGVHFIGPQFPTYMSESTT